jgi:oligopeptide transport system permease protein
VGFLATAMAILIGVTYGSVSAFAGGTVDLVMMRLVDVMYGLPYMFLVIIVLAAVRDAHLPVDSFWVLFFFIGGLSWMTMARIARGQVLSLREREFVEAARALGVSTPAILARHVLPNMIGPVVVYTTLTVPSVMLSEAFLSFLGLGISEPHTSWGVLLSEGASVLVGRYWWMLLFPGAMLAATLYCLNAVGDGLRDAFDVASERGT